MPELPTRVALRERRSRDQGTGDENDELAHGACSNAQPPEKRENLAGAPPPRAGDPRAHDPK